MATPFMTVRTTAPAGILTEIRRMRNAASMGVAALSIEREDRLDNLVPALLSRSGQSPLVVLQSKPMGHHRVSI